MRRMGRVLGGLLAGVLVLAVSGCGEAAVARVEPGAPAPELAAVDLDGKPVRLLDLRGTVVLLNVWATWCEPCREEIPALQALQERLSSRGFEVVGVSIDFASQREKIRPFADSYGVTYTLWHDSEKLVQARYRVVGAPATFLIDRDGILRWKGMGPIQPDDPALMAAIEAALDNQS